MKIRGEMPSGLDNGLWLLTSKPNERGANLTIEALQRIWYLPERRFGIGWQIKRHEKPRHQHGSPPNDGESAIYFQFATVYARFSVDMAL